ncbi:MAG: hypothetical protein V4519_02820 [Patescibacteria group bacterium]
MNVVHITYLIKQHMFDIKKFFSTLFSIGKKQNVSFPENLWKLTLSQ